jgi:hypothetical protein
MSEYQPVPFEAARAAAISLRSKFTKSAKRRECPPVFVIFNFKKAPNHASGPHRLSFPHPVREFPIQSGIVFVKGGSTPWSALFSETGISLRAISISQLRKKYTKQKAQDKLFKSAEYFFCEKGATATLPGLLRSQFFSMNRQPIIVELAENAEQIASEIREAVQSADLYVRNDVKCFVRVGAFNLTFDNLAENVIAGIEQALKLIPKARARVESISMMASGIEMPPFWRKHPQRMELTAAEVLGIAAEETSEAEES